MIRIALIASVLALAACGDKTGPIAPVVTHPVTPPAALLTCRAAPPVPRDAETQKDVARFIVRLAEAGEDCRSKLGAVREWAEEESAPAP